MLVFHTSLLRLIYTPFKWAWLNTSLKRLMYSGVYKKPILHSKNLFFFFYHIILQFTQHHIYYLLFYSFIYSFLFLFLSLSLKPTHLAKKSNIHSTNYPPLSSSQTKTIGKKTQLSTPQLATAAATHRRSHIKHNPPNDPYSPLPIATTAKTHHHHQSKHNPLPPRQKPTTTTTKRNPQNCNFLCQQNPPPSPRKKPTPTTTFAHKTQHHLHQQNP